MSKPNASTASIPLKTHEGIEVLVTDAQFENISTRGELTAEEKAIKEAMDQARKALEAVESIEAGPVSTKIIPRR